MIDTDGTRANYVIEGGSTVTVAGTTADWYSLYRTSEFDYISLDDILDDIEKYQRDMKVIAPRYEQRTDKIIHETRLHHRFYHLYKHRSY